MSFEPRPAAGLYTANVYHPKPHANIFHSYSQRVPTLLTHMRCWLTARIRAQTKQRSWSHSACASAEIERALNDIRVTAIEADVMMGVRGNQVVPVMAHPTLLSDALPSDWDTTFEQFLENSVGRRYLKLDFIFKQIEAVEPSLKILKRYMPRLRATGTGDRGGIWLSRLNADVLPGPNGRGGGGPSACASLSGTLTGFRAYIFEHIFLAVIFF